MADETPTPPATLEELLEKSHHVRENLRAMLDELRADAQALGETMDRDEGLTTAPDVSPPDTLKPQE